MTDDQASIIKCRVKKEEWSGNGACITMVTNADYCHVCNAKEHQPGEVIFDICLASGHCFLNCLKPNKHAGRYTGFKLIDDELKVEKANNMVFDKFLEKYPSSMYGKSNLEAIEFLYNPVERVTEFYTADDTLSYNSGCFNNDCAAKRMRTENGQEK